MDFFKLRFANVFMLFVIGISIGFLWGKRNKDYSASKDEYRPVYAQPVQPQPEKKFLIPGQEQGKNEVTPMDDDEEYQLSVIGENADAVRPEPEQYEELRENSRKNYEDNSESFFASPSSFYGKQVQAKLQMLTAKKTKNGWRLNFVYSDSDRNLSYLYVDDPDMVSTENPDFKIGYYYRISFKCGKGELKDGNRLISIEATGDKTPWASGISAIER